MPNTYFQFKQFRIEQAQSGMKVTTDGCLFGAWVANELEKNEPEKILDIGTGTGLLSLMLAQKTINAKIDAVEINELAYREATLNFKNSKWRDRLSCYHTSVQDFMSDTKYDMIICNPPFFKDSQRGVDSTKNQAVHSNNLKMEELLTQSLRLLNPNGHLYLLYPEREMNAFMKVSDEKIFPIHRVILRNQKEQQVFRMMVRFSLIEKEETIAELIIRQKNRKYTPESWELLKCYYLDYNDPKF
ncbi:tRNA1(Val) (adenine(37)-N6)-methyltransferase [Ekhidna sp.]|uniref:tRNA1(Val) (adenine(37)-N6)-methyltransferase n=1 Tax=Ekhidna sp. TaxID=2608089 RepID=UPI0035192118